MKANNFKALQEENEDRFANKSEGVKKNVNHSIGLVKMIGNMFDLFIPRIFSVFTYMSGGSPSDKNQDEDKKNTTKYPNTK